MELNDLEFSKLLNEKRHNELLASLESIVKLMSNEDDSIIQAIEKQCIGIDLLNKNLSDFFGKSDKNVVDLSAVTKAIESLKIQKPLSQKWEFEIIRDENGLIKNIKAKN